MNQTSTPQSPKALALAVAATINPQATGLVEYRSEGRLLIIGDTNRVSEILPRISDKLRAHALLTDNATQPPFGLVFEPVDGGSIQVSGYLGAFEVTSNAPVQRADIVLDLQSTPSLTMYLKPAGYFSPGNDEAALTTAIDSANELIGRFDKPQYFGYKENICAHSASEIEGCRACIDACPAQAIISIGAKVEVNPHLCQGGGTCATVCPTGAMTYRYPSPNDTLDRIRRLLRTYHQAGGKDAQLVLHGESYDPPASGSDQLPMTLEEIGSVGIEIWLAALAFGARGVHLAVPTDSMLADPIIQSLQQQADIANNILAGLGFPPAIQWLDNEAPRAIMPTIKAATFGATGGKRETLFAAVDHLVAQADNPPAVISLPVGAPLGRIQVDTSGCTLCMSCVSVCPAKALGDGGGEPALRIYEANCVQCGLCESACPEQVITREPRLLTDGKRRLEPVVLHQEPPFHCIRCDKAFATQSVIERMTEKLAGHHMYQDPAAMNRLKMCADCRVKDMMSDDA
ncbi:MAG: 4Fe-4S binding protein [Burkholderiaceae bacterium]